MASMSSRSPWRGRAAVLRSAVDGRAGHFHSRCYERASAVCQDVNMNKRFLHLWVDFTFLKHRSF